ncbi:MAG: thioredoxin family protein [Limisphaerales bacterium]
MNPRSFLAVAAAFVAAGTLAVRAADAAWLTDATLAQTKARTEGRMVMLEFTGSDWCPPCKKMAAEVFPSAEFKAFAGKNLVPVKLDFPQRTKLPAAQQQANDALAKKYGVNAFPTLIFLRPDGSKAGELVGYTDTKSLIKAAEKFQAKK